MNMVVSHILDTLTNSPSGTEDNVYSSHSDFSDQLKKDYQTFLKKLDITWISCDSLHAWL